MPDTTLRRRRRLARASGRVALALMLGGGVAACGDGSTKPGSSDSSAPVHVGRPADVTTFDPIAVGDQWSARTQTAVYSALVSYADGKIQPELASAWSVTPDGREYTFTLRKSKFSDGKPVTAEDVVFSLKRVLSKHSSWSFLLGPVKDIGTANDGTVRISLSKPYPPLLTALSTFAGSVYSEAAFKAKGADAFFHEPVSSGPYYVADWSRGSSLVLKRNDGYGGAGAGSGPREIDFSVTADDTSRLQQLQAGSLDIAEAVPPSQVKELSAGAFKVVSVPGAANSWVQFNVKHRGLDNRDVRCALAGAIDRKAMAKTAFSGVAEPSTSIFPASTRDHADVSADMPPFDLDAARKRLQTALGSKTLSLTVTTTDEVAGLRDALQIWRSDLNTIGVKLKVESVEATTQRSLRSSGDYDAITVPWINDTFDPSELAGFVLHSDSGKGAFYTGYTDAGMDRLVDKAAADQDEKGRAEVYAQIQTRAAQDCVFVPIVDRPDLYAVGSGISGFAPDALGNYNFQHVRVAR